MTSLEPAESRPRIRRAFSVISHAPDVVELRTGVWNPQSFLLTDQSGSGKLVQIVAGLDGTASPKELAKQVGVAKADVDAVLDHLWGLSAIEDRPASALDAYLNDLMPHPAPGRSDQADLASARVLGTGNPELVGLIGEQLGMAGIAVTQASDDPLWQRLGAVNPAAYTDALSLSELAEEFEPWRGALVIYADTIVNPSMLGLFNRVALARDISWIHGGLDGPFLYAGPTFAGRRSACYACFESRVTMNLREGSSYQRYKEALARSLVSNGEPAVIRPLLNLLAAHLALEAINYLASGTNFTIERVLGIFVPAMEIAFNEVLPMPGCAACSPQPERDDATLYFDPRAWRND